MLGFRWILEIDSEYLCVVLQYAHHLISLGPREALVRHAREETVQNIAVQKTQKADGILTFEKGIRHPCNLPDPFRVAHRTNLCDIHFRCRKNKRQSQLNQSLSS